MIPLCGTLYAPGAAGVPSTTLQLYQNVCAGASSLEYTITDQFGFESARVQRVGTFSEFLWLADYLGANLVLASPDGAICWEGQFTSIEATLGQERHARSLDAMGNRVKCRYTTVNGVPGVTSTASDTTSQARYGIKDLTVPLPATTSGEADSYRDRTLDKTRYPKRTPSSNVATGQMSGMDLTLGLTGWYGTLDWIQATNNSQTQTAVHTQVGNILTAIAAVNAFIATSTANLTASSVNATEKMEPDTPYRQKVESILALGTGTARYAWGVYEDRVFSAETWAGASPGTIHYFRQLGSGFILDSAGSIVQPWAVRPNKMYQIGELLDLNPAANEQDTAARYPIARVTFRADASGYGVQLEPADSDNLTALLAGYDARGW